MIQYVKDIQMMLDNNNFDRQRLLEILESFEIIPTIPILIPAGNKILRSSTNDEHKFHEPVARLNYPPAEYARTDRTSLKGKPMFYGTVFTSSAKTEGLCLVYSVLLRLLIFFEIMMRRAESLQLKVCGLIIEV